MPALLMHLQSYSNPTKTSKIKFCACVYLHTLCVKYKMTRKKKIFKTMKFFFFFLRIFFSTTKIHINVLQPQRLIQVGLFTSRDWYPVVAFITVLYLLEFLTNNTRYLVEVERINIPGVWFNTFIQWVYLVVAKLFQ